MPVLAALLVSGCSTALPGSPGTSADEHPAPKPPATSKTMGADAAPATEPHATSTNQATGVPGTQSSTALVAVGDEGIGTARRGLPAVLAAQAESTATAFVRAWTRKDLDPDRWWAGVRSSFTPDAARIYRYVDPAAVPGTAVTATGDLHTESTQYLALVSVHTDAGAYEVTLLHFDGAWLVDRADPP